MLTGYSAAYNGAAIMPRFMPCYRLLNAAAVLLLVLQTVGATDIPAQNAGRPSVALVLSGGAALGFAHNGVLEVLEEFAIPIDMVVGTSMGAVIGGFYAAGYSPSDIRTVSAEVDWPAMFSDTLARHYYGYREKKISEQYFLEAGIDRDGIHLGGGLLAGQRITALLAQLTLRIPDNIEFDSLPRPYRAVAADVISGEEIVFSSGSLTDAMRASMNIPGLFKPYRIGDRYLIDGGVVNNMPVDVARAMGADIVIAVEVGEPLLTTVERLSRSPLASIDQSTKILIEANVRPQRQLADLVITPDLEGFSLTSFSEALEIMRRGEAAARNMLPQLQELRDLIARGRELQPAQPERGVYFTTLSDPTIGRVRVQGGSESEREAALQRFEQFSGSTVGAHDLVVPVDEVYSQGRLDLVKTQILREPDGSNTLLVTLVAPAGSRSSIRIGMRYAGMISSSAHSKMVVTQNLRVNDITGRGSYWTASLGFVNTLALSTAYFQPLGANLYLQPRLSYAADSDRYSGFGPLGTVIEYQDVSAGLELGLLLSRYGELRGGYRYTLFRSPARDPDDDHEWATISALIGAIGADSRDSRMFPSSGSAAELEYQIALPGAGGDLQFQRLEASAETHLQLSPRLSIGALIAGGTDFTDTIDEQRSLHRFNSFELGDERVFIGYKNNPQRGQHRLSLAAELRVGLEETPGTLSAHPVIVLDGGAVDSWQSHPESIGDVTVNWTSSVGLGVRFSDSFAALLRVGILRELQPFIALNLGAFGL